MTLEKSLRYFVCILVVLTSSTLNVFSENINATRGFLLTGPKQVLRGTDEHFCLHLQGVQSAGQVTLALQSKNENIGLPLRHRIDPDKDDYDGCIPLVLTVPSDIEGGYRQLRLTVDWEDPNANLVIDSSKEISVSYEKQLLQLIQTDKPWYTPGQLVRFRTITLTHLLQPVPTMLTRVWIVDPSSIVIAEWKNVTSDLGFVQLELHLSAEPVQGVWQINVDNGVFKEKKEFEVKEFVLPRFEVTVEGPYAVSPTAKTFNLSVCAKYTFGQPVLGDVEIEVKHERLWYFGSLGYGRPIFASNKPQELTNTIKLTGKIAKDTGCHQVVFPLSQLGIDKQNSFYNGNIEITGHVTEKGTEIKRNATIKVPLRIEKEPNIEINLESGSLGIFKLGLPYIGKGKLLQLPNGNPILDAKINVCVKEGFRNSRSLSSERIKYYENRTCSNVFTDDRGEFTYSFTPKEREVVEYKIEARYAEKNKYASATSKPAYSPSRSFAIIESIPSQPIPCSSNLTIKVYFNNVESGKKLRLHYFVTGRGDLLAHGIKEAAQIKTVNVNLPGVLDETKSPWQVSALDLEVTVLPSFYPRAAVMVYYVRKDGEVVTAQTEFKVASCFPNPVTLQWDAETKYPGAAANLKIHSAPGSLCGLSVVDKSVTLTKPEWQLKEETVLGPIRSFRIESSTYPKQATSDNQYCRQFGVQEKAEIVRRSLIIGSGPGILPPYRFPPLRQLRYSSFYKDAIEAFDEAGLLVISSWDMESRPCDNYYVEVPSFGTGWGFGGGLQMGGAVGFAASIGTGFGAGVPVNRPSVTQEVPEPAETPPTPVVDLRAYFPETWLWDLYPTDLQGEVLIQQELPHTITSWVGRALCVSNTSGFGMSPEASIQAFQPFFLELHLPYSIKRGEKLTLKVSVYNYLASSLPVKVSIDGSNEFELVSTSSSQGNCIEARDSAVIEFVIQPTALGRLNITIRGHVDPSSVNPCGTGQSPSAKDALVKSLLVVPEGFPVEKTFASLVCPNEYSDDKKVVWDLELPSDTVNGSARAWVSVVGDLMGPALDGLTNLVQLPTGCGEQNMVTFTPLIYVSDYLEASQQLDESTKKKAVSYMRSGYQRELTYRHEDGSYSAFGQRDQVGSLWLTAFVVKSFAGARKFIYIDNDDMRKSVQWILSKQLEKGCFPTIGTLLNKDLKGGLSSDEDDLAGLTAFTLVSLLESKWDVGSEIFVNAIKCMKAQANFNLYTKALMTYGLALSKDKEAREYMDTLLEKAQQQQSNLWWEADGKGMSTNIETTSYALLALLQFRTNSDMAKASQIVRWLVKQRNAQGGFRSTQDTVMGLQALAAYATAVGVTNVDINLEITADKLQNTVKVQEKDKLVQKQVQVPVLPTKLQVVAEGTGCAVLQTTLRYNIQTSPKKEAFSLTLTSEPIGKESACAARRLKICAKYLLPGASNMAIVEVDMVSGYAVDKKGLQKLPTQNPKVKRAEEKDDTVVLYFDSVDEKGVCSSFAVWPAFEVNDALPANVKISDYYEQENFVGQTYILPTGCGLAASPIFDNEV